MDLGMDDILCDMADASEWDEDWMEASARWARLRGEWVASGGVWNELK